MTKRVNKLFLIVAVFFLIISVMIPIGDYFMSKYIVFGKYEGITANEMTNLRIFYESEMSNTGFVTYYSFYSYFQNEYATINGQSEMYKAVQQLMGNSFNKIITWTPQNETENVFIWYILDKILWLFVAYCIFVIPISMVDLFSKAIKKGVE